MENITEEQGVHKQWYIEAKEQTMETLPDFINHLLKDYGHDYGTICHAITAAGIATMTAMNKSEQGGITGLQAGAIMWEFIRNWNHSSNKTGLKIVDYDNMLYPHYADRFDKTIDKGTWEALQKQVQANIDGYNQEMEDYVNIKLPEWEKKIAAFIEKYPDYINNPAKYDQLGAATGYQHEERRKKVEEGFEEAPYKPYEPIVHPDVLTHWRGIVAGIIPFGYKIEP